MGQSMGGLTAPRVCDRLDVERIVLLNAMTPAPGETGEERWADTGQSSAALEYAERPGRDPRTLDDLWQLYFHDAAPEPLALARARPEIEQSGRSFQDPWPPLAAWADEVPRRAGRPTGPLEFQRRVFAERLGTRRRGYRGRPLSALTLPGPIAELLTRHNVALLWRATPRLQTGAQGGSR